MAQSVFIEVQDDYSGKSGFFCDVDDATGKAVFPAEGGRVRGVVKVGAGIGQVVEVVVLGQTPITCAGAIGLGRTVASTSGGKAKAAQQGETGVGRMAEPSLGLDESHPMIVEHLGTVSGAVDEDGDPIIVIKGPKTSDGRVILQPSQFRGDVQPHFPGCGDNIAEGTRYGGPMFGIQSTVAETAFLDWQMKEWHYIAGGHIQWVGAVFGDRVAYKIRAPATPSTANAGAGSHDKVPVGGGLNVFIPSADTTGSDDVDLAATKSANVSFTAVAPVPAADANGDPNGYHDWDSATELVTVNAAGRGGFNLFDQDISLVGFAPGAGIPILKDGMRDLTLPSVRGKRLLPHWIHRVEVLNTTAKTLEVVWDLLLARVSTV